VRVQDGPEELKGIEEHIERRGDHGTMIPSDQELPGTGTVESKTDAICADHKHYRGWLTSLLERQRPRTRRTSASEGLFADHTRVSGRHSPSIDLLSQHGGHWCDAHQMLAFGQMGSPSRQRKMPTRPLVGARPA
jgi:hypothetical protein